jgi:hypothetical protein
MYIASGGWSLRERSRLHSNLRGDLNRTLHYYDKVEIYGRVWDAAHQRVSEDLKFVLNLPVHGGANDGVRTGPPLMVGLWYMWQTNLTIAS